MIILIDLYRCELPLVDDVLIRQRTQIKPVVEADGVGRTLAEDEELSFKVFLVESLGIGDFWLVTFAIGRKQNDKRLQDDWLS